MFERSVALPVKDAGRSLSDLVRRMDEVFLTHTGERMRVEESTSRPQSSLSMAARKRRPMIRTVTESSIILRRNLTKLIWVPMLLFFSLFQPLLWLLLFTQIFKKFGDFPQFQALGSSSYLMFFAPSGLVTTVLTSAFQSGMGMVADLEQGMLDKFLISPIRRSSVLVGRSWPTRRGAAPGGLDPGRRDCDGPASTQASSAQS